MSLNPTLAEIALHLQNQLDKLNELSKKHARSDFGILGWHTEGLIKESMSNFSKVLDAQIHCLEQIVGNKS